MKVEIDGNIWEMPVQCMEVALEYEVAGRWYPHGHPVMLEQQCKEELARKLLGKAQAPPLVFGNPI